MSAAASTLAVAPRPARARAPRPALFRAAARPMVRVPSMPVEVFGSATALESLPGSLLPADARVRAAVAVGSPSLYERLRAATPASTDAPELRRKLLRYVIRMSSRPTPFGLFAGVAQTTWGAATDLVIAPHESTTRTRPDMEWLLLRLTALEARPEVRRRLRLWTNPAAFVYGGRVVVSKRQNPGSRAAGSVSVRATSVVVRALDLARHPVPYAELAAALLAASPAAGSQKVDALLDGLHASGVLLTDLRPAPTADDPVEGLLRRLEGIPEAEAVHAEIAELARAARAWDALTDRERAEAYVRLATGDGPEGSGGTKSRVQVDMAVGLRGATILDEIGVEAARAAELLLAMSPSPKGLRFLAQYRADFAARYGEDREVPLLELLDPECGVPYWMRPTSLDDPKRDRVVVDLATRALFERRPVVHVDDALLKQLRTCEIAPGTAPTSLDVNVVVAAASRESLDRGEYQVILGAVVGALSAGCMLGRFADLLPQAKQELSDILRAEQQTTGGAVHAELVDQPRDLHAANVVVRPAIAAHELPVGALPSVPPENVIPLRELVVGVRDDRFYLRWPKGGADVVIRTGHMLNPAGSLTVAQFLHDVSRDGDPVLAGFHWGPASGFPFLPRIQVGRIVLSLAHWWLPAADARRELHAQDAAAFRAAFAQWRERWMLPRHVYVGSVDHRLLLDLDDPDHVEELRRDVVRLAPDDSLEIQEGLPGVDDAWLEGPDGHYVCELSVALVQDPAKRRPVNVNVNVPEPPVPPRDLPPRSAVLRSPGTDWLFLKLYTPKFLEEDLLAGPVRKFARHVVERGLADAWFFIRYGDPDLHVRLRFHGDPARLVSELTPAAFAWLGGLVDERVCTRFVVDTYDREVERYGGQDGMRIAEAIFAADSVATADLLALPGAAKADARSDLAVLTVADLLDALGLGAPARLAWLKGLGLAKSRADFAADYRQRRDRLVALLRAPVDDAALAFGKDAVDALARRREALRPLGRELAEASVAGRLTQPRATLLRSYVHMHCNRLLGPDGEAERRLYGVLVRAHEALHHERTPR